MVSIHAPHAGGDGSVAGDAPTVYVSIHAPHAEGDRESPRGCRWSRRFNPRPPCGGRPCGQSIHVTGHLVSIHAPHAEGDCLRSR